MSKPAVLITGASSGIGAVYADRFARRGHDVILVARDVTRLWELTERLRRETSTRAELLVADQLAQHALPQQVPVGIVTVVVGGGYLVALLLRGVGARR